MVDKGEVKLTILKKTTNEERLFFERHYIELFEDFGINLKNSCKIKKLENKKFKVQKRKETRVKFLTKVLDPYEVTMFDVDNVEKYRDGLIFELTALPVNSQTRRFELIDELKQTNTWLKNQYLHINPQIYGKR